MSRIIEALEREKASLEKEIEKLRYLLFEARPLAEILELQEKAREIIDRNIDYSEKIKLIEPLAIKEKSLWAVIKKIDKIRLNGPEKLAHLEHELFEINSYLWRLKNGIKS